METVALSDLEAGVVEIPENAVVVVKLDDSDDRRDQWVALSIAAGQLAIRLERLVMLLGPGDDLEALSEREMRAVGWKRCEEAAGRVVGRGWCDECLQGVDVAVGRGSTRDSRMLWYFEPCGHTAGFFRGQRNGVDVGEPEWTGATRKVYLP